MKKGLINKIFLLMLITIIFPINAKAITFKLSKSTDNIKPGGIVTVTLSAEEISSQEPLTNYNLNIRYDANKLEFAGGVQSSKANVSNSNGTINVSNKSSSEEKSGFEIAKFNFKASSSASGGNTALTLSGDCYVNVATEEGTEKKKVSPTLNSTQITILSLGTDASLSSLKIPNTTLKPSFSSSVTSYTATIQDITELTINATPTDSNAKVSVSENAKSLQKGENKIAIVVTSEDGQSSKTYSIVVTLNLTPTDEELLKANATLKALTVKGEKIDFDSTEKKYYLTVPYETKKLTINATPTNKKAKVEIEGEKKLIVGKNIIKITVTSEDKTNKENYQIIVTREDEEKEIVQTCPDETSSTEWIVFSISMLLTFTLGIILGYFVCKKDILKKIFKKKKKKKDEPVSVETLSDTIDLSETVKKVKKNSKKK